MTVSNRARTLAVAVIAALAMALVPAAAANAVGPGTATLTFTSAGAPLANQFVSITAPDNPFGGGFTDNDGVLALTDLALGSYSGTVNSLSAPPFSFSFFLTAAAPDFQATFDVPPAPTGPGTMTLTLVSDTPLSFFTAVQVSGPAGDRFADFSGNTATLSNMVLGDYTAVVFPSQDNQGGSVSFTLTAEAPDFVGELHLPAWPTGTSSISGTIVDDNGVPIEGAQVNLSSEVRQFPSVFTASDGTYAVMDLPAGGYFVSAFAFGYFSRSTDQLPLAEGEAAVVDFTLPIRNSSVSGRVVDGDGNPIAGIFVEARNGQDFAGAMTGADGTFLISEMSAGEWTVVGGGPGTPWQPSQVVVTLESAESATIADLILEPRTTGGVFGAALDFSATPFPTSISGICATLRLPNGTLVASAEPTGEDGTFGFFDVAPGDYTVKVVDCDPTRVPRYAKQFYGSGTTLADAVVFSVTAGQDVQLGSFSLVPSTKPTHPATAVPTKDLKPANRGDIQAPDKAKQDTKITIQVGAQHAGEWVSVWLHDPKDRLGGWRQVASDGTVKVRIPAGYELGEHKLAVQNSADQLIGWTKIKIKN